MPLFGVTTSLEAVYEAIAWLIEHTRGTMAGDRPGNAARGFRSAASARSKRRFYRRAFGPALQRGSLLSGPAFPFSRRRRAWRPEAQMGAAPPAVGAAETVERNWPTSEFFVDLALAAAEENPGAKNCSDARQLVHMPMRQLVAPHMTPDPRCCSAAPLGRAAIDIESRREQRALCAGLHP